MLLNDIDIRRLCQPSIFDGAAPMISPFSEAVSGGGIISYGLTSAGYDLRMGPHIFAFKSTYGGLILDPRRFKELDFCDKVFDRVYVQESDWESGFILAPHSYCLVMSLEYLRIPRHLKARCVGKSTYARVGLIINTTPVEPEWEGHLTIEIGNLSSSPVPLFPGQGICQMEFEVLTAPPGVSYADKGGQYQGQTEVTPARVKE